MHSNAFRYCDNLASIPVTDLTRFLGEVFNPRMMMCAPYGITAGVRDGKVFDFLPGYVNAPACRDDWHLVW